MRLSQIEKYFQNFFFMSRIYIKFQILWKKDEPKTWFVSQMIDRKKRDYLKA